MKWHAPTGSTSAWTCSSPWSTPKIESLSDKAFRALVEPVVRYCGRQRTERLHHRPPVEGHCAEGPRRAVKSAGLVHPIDLGGGGEVHDYLGYQRSRKEIEEESRPSGPRSPATRPTPAGETAPPPCREHALSICIEHAPCIVTAYA